MTLTLIKAIGINITRVLGLTALAQFEIAHGHDQILVGAATYNYRHISFIRHLVPFHLLL